LCCHRHWRLQRDSDLHDGNQSHNDRNREQNQLQKQLRREIALFATVIDCFFCVAGLFLNTRNSPWTRFGLRVPFYSRYLFIRYVWDTTVVFLFISNYYNVTFWAGHRFFGTRTKIYTTTLRCIEYFVC